MVRTLSLPFEFTGNKIREAGGNELGELLKVNTSLKSLRAGGEDSERWPHYLESMMVSFGR